MIINTRCSLFAMIIDALMTAVGWVGFYYLLSQGFPTLSASPLDVVQAPLPTPWLPTLLTLSIYLTVAAFNALLLMLWVRYHKLFFIKLRRHGTPSNLNDNAVASSFMLSCNLLHKLQDSRVSVIHHNARGDIARLELDELLQPPSNCEIFELTRAA
ncbi:poly-beta-1,6-N-acetyl-D-glucosamine biosynthesis protein PgaD [Paralcaligenes ureilyticus]|uniref:Biofilm PGA synthesis protein PgaD n=1 Tax=Paralcaligenes ureilyticus TaxID=627131 RepID=A0A4R3MAX0_9BURK|nr:poly-beta-1,6-N-acetyl-D-glucosamine biosynthesis protein PgaD [Paralcaligenes ureilyticus]TCT10426.1 biofilm PGA synthesis protein PgaD [Paralcaligenes ureilyticus]